KVVLGIAKSSHRLAMIFDAYIAYRRYLELRPRGTGPREARKAVTSLEAEYVNPRSALGDFGAGELAYVNNKFDEAIDCFDAGLEKAPLSAITYYNRANAWYAKATISGAGVHARSAISDYDRVLLLKPGHGTALAGRALCWLLLRKYDPALEDARKAMSLLPQAALSFNTAGLASFSLERYRDAVEYYDRAIKLDSKEATYRINRARAKWSLRDFDGALADLKTASELEITPEQGTEIRGIQDKIRIQREQGG
ncbi:MAG: tetratricopeptide repeat protein, partial [Phycisphaeraceae bacterium]|nr:tetratricopeptide repeat protein [Phycisphaeraceae bacterium]